jgi:hypothetical protein
MVARSREINMRKLITGSLIVLIFISVCGVLKTVFDPHQVKQMPAAAVATTPMPGPNMVVVSRATPSVPAPEATPTPAPVPTPALGPLESRVVKHQPDQFRKGAMTKEELSTIKKAINTIPWSRNSNPKEAANEDYAAILKECDKSSVHDLLTDLITEAVSNDYRPNNEAANGVYSSELNSDFENDNQNDHSKEKSTGEMTGGKAASAESGLSATANQPDVPVNATLGSSPQRPSSAEVSRSKMGHARHRSSVRHKVVDAKMQLIALWHQSLALAEKSPK